MSRPKHQDRKTGPSQRQLRAGELVRHTLADILREEHLADPALAGISVTISEVKVSPDLKHAVCYVEPLGGENAAAVVEALNRASRLLRGRLGHRIDMRFTPQLRFVHDETFDAASHMNRLLDDPRVRRDVDHDSDDEPGGDLSDFWREPLMARRRKGEAVSGWICLDKPCGPTSTQAVGRVRRAFNAQKAGHAGTLDPAASGILPIALGEATKTVPFLVDADKAYRFTVRWGIATASFDTEGAVTVVSDARPSGADIAEALNDFVGEIDQVPPAFSAVKVGGERAYDLAREGIEVTLAPRKVTIHEAVLTGAPDADHAVIEIVCGKGTYVRALARDLAHRLGVVGHVSELRRTRVGSFAAAAAIGLEQLEDLCHSGALLEVLLPVETALDDIPELAVTAEDAFRLTQGRSIVLLPRQVESLQERIDASRMVSARHGARIVALCEMRAGRLNPTRVFHLT